MKKIDGTQKVFYRLKYTSFSKEDEDFYDEGNLSGLKRARARALSRMPDEPTLFKVIETSEPLPLKG